MFRQAIEGITPATTETAALTRFDVIFDVEARNTAKFHNDITVHLRGPHPATVELPTDEGPKQGGDGTAPYPLAYFASALTACIMTQLRAFSRRLDIPLTTIAISTRLHWQAQQRGNAPYASEPVAFTMDIDLGGGAAMADKQRLINAAAKGCFVERSLKPGIVRHRLKVGEDWISV
jgi:uncharacterized OsmC-like protein